MYFKKVLDNGLSIVLEKIPHVRSVTIGVWVKVGSIYEKGRVSGMSHFIEHMLFKGTKTRDAQEIAATLDRVGGQLNAFSSKEFTCYYAKVIDQHIGIAIDLLSDLILNSTFDAREIKREKKVVMEEIKMYEDSPDELIHEIFAQELWSGSPWGQPILGIRENIEVITRKDIREFFDAFYKPSNIVVSIAGSIDQEETVARIEKAFAKMKGTGLQRRFLVPKTKSGMIVRNKDIEQVHLCVGMPGFSKSDKDKYALTVLSIALGGGMSSRLFQEIREKRGLVYTIYSYQTDYRQTGLFNVYAGTSKENIPPLLELVLVELDKISAKGFSEDELLRAREQLKGSLILGLESTSNRMSRLARLEIYFKKNISMDSLIKKIDSITNEDIIRVMGRIYSNDKLLIAALGPVDAGDLKI